MISMYAEYSGRTLYVALSSDTIEGAKNGDKLYEMDTGKRYVYNETNDAWDEQPEEGGGGDPYEVARHFVAMTLQEYVDEGTTRINNKAFMDMSTLNKVIIHNATGTFQQAFSGTSVRYVAFPKMMSLTNYNGSNNTPLYGLDFTALSSLNSYAFSKNSNMKTLILRRASGVVTLGNVNVFSQTPFASGNSGGTLYVPSALIDSYQNATNWSTILAYPNNQIMPIEGSVYETQYADGTPIQ